MALSACSKRSRSIVELLGVADGYFRWAKTLTLARATGQSGEHLPPEDTPLFRPAPKIALVRHLHPRVFAGRLPSALRPRRAKQDAASRIARRAGGTRPSLSARRDAPGRLSRRRSCGKTCFRRKTPRRGGRRRARQQARHPPSSPRYGPCRHQRAGDRAV